MLNILNKLAITTISLLFLANFPLNARSETVLEKINRTGELKAGVRNDAIPFSYVDENDRVSGYSVELIRLIHRRLENQLDKPIKLDLVEVSVENRFSKVENNSVDLVCEATTMTQERLEKVAFSIPYFITGAQFLVKLENADNFDINGTLAKIPIAYIPSTTTDEIIRQIYPFADWRKVTNRQEGVDKLKRGEVTAMVSDGILLVGEIVRQGKDPRQFALTPDRPITTELYGCMMPKNEPQWKEFVDGSIGSQENRQLQEEWFNLKSGNFPYIILTSP